MKAAQIGQDRTEPTAVTFQFNDDNGANIGPAVRNEIMKPKIEVDGEPLRHSLVNQRDAAETVFQLLSAPRI